MLKDEIKNINSSKKELRKFGLSVGTVLLIISLFLFYFEKPAAMWFFFPADLLIFFGFVLPQVLLPLHKIWMTLAVILGFIMSRVILTILFYIIITPLSLLAKLFGKDFLDRKIEPTRKSYWNIREVKKYDPIDTERQF